MRVIKASGIYAIINKVNDKAYIGSTLYGFNHRWGVHKSYLKYGNHNNRHLQHSWNKYGADNFDFVVLEYVDDADGLLIKEQEWIDRWTPLIGCYNITSAAGPEGDRRARQLTEEHRQRIGDGNRGKILSDQTKRRIGDSNRGKRRTPEQLQRQSELMKARGRNRKFIEAGHASNIKTYDCMLVSPDGTIHTRITNLAAFCKEYELQSNAMSWIMRGKLKSHRGWRLLGTEVFGTAALAAATKQRMAQPEEKERMRKLSTQIMQDPDYKARCTKALRDPGVRERARQSTIRNTYRFLDPGGTVHEVRDLRAFCDEHGLNLPSMRCVANPNNKLRSHKGWVTCPSATTDA